MFNFFFFLQKRDVNIPSTFKLLNLRLYEHRYLGNLNIDFVGSDEVSNGPYTSVIIGSNGTGKSQVLKMIVEIFRELALHQSGSKEKGGTLGYKFSVSFQVDDNKYLFTNVKTNSGKGSKKTEAHINGEPLNKKQIRLPQHLIVSSILLNDKFPMVNSQSNDMYQYMGVRRSPGVAGTKTYIRRTVDNIYDALDRKEFMDNVRRVLTFLGFSEHLIIYYSPRYRGDMYTGELTVQQLTQWFQDWDKDNRRKTEPYSLSYFKKLKKGGADLESLVNFMNKLTERFTGGRTKYIEYDIIHSSQIKKDYEYIRMLYHLDLLSYPSISVRKSDHDFDLDESSSGEYHLLASLLSILAKIKPNSLVLLDEPEISLHPNWQMRYVHFLKEIFETYPSCHFIIASHSHFLVSDLQDNTSSVTALKRDTKTGELVATMLKGSTYGLSAEDILYNVFQVPTTRNRYLADDIGKLLSDIANGKGSSAGIIGRIRELNKIEPHLKEVDPLKTIIHKLNKKFIPDNAF